MNYELKLRKIAKQLKDKSQHELSDKVLCALAALTDSIEPKANLSYSYIMRDLRKNHPDKVSKFQKIYKYYFDKALSEDMEDFEEIALMHAVEELEADDIVIK